MIDMADIYRRLRDNYDEGDTIQVHSVIPLMNTFIVNFTREDALERRSFLVAIFGARGIQQIVMAGDA